MRLLIAVGNCLVMLGGWFECLLMYNGSSLGYLYGLCFALFQIYFGGDFQVKLLENFV
jgi:hypothetical protein